MKPRLAALSVDLDAIGCYHAIHGLAPRAGGPEPVYARAAERYRSLWAELGVPCTFFAVGSDLDGSPEAAASLRGLVEAGHEAGNHTYSHRYDFTRGAPAEIATDIERGAAAIETATGTRPVGFRAPGYTTTDAVYDALEAQGYAYSSSVFPCPAYFGAKSAAIGAIALRGRRSHSIVDTPRVLSAPADPYRPGRPWWTRGADGGLAELPIGVTRRLRLPVIGTFLVLAGPRGARTLARGIVGRPLVNLELHGIDVLGADEDGLDALRGHQPEVAIPVERKLQTLRSVVQMLRDEGYHFVTLAQATGEMRRAGLA